MAHRCLSCNHIYKAFPCDLNGKETPTFPTCPTCRPIYAPKTDVPLNPCKICGCLTSTACSFCKMNVCPSYICIYGRMSEYIDAIPFRNNKYWRDNLNEPMVKELHLICDACWDYTQHDQYWVNNFEEYFATYKKNILLDTCWVLSKSLKKYNMYDRRFIIHIAKHISNF